MTKEIVRSEYNWSNYTLPQDACMLGCMVNAQKGTWLRFDTTNLIPEKWNEFNDFIVGVMWTFHNGQGGIFQL